MYVRIHTIQIGRMQARTYPDKYRQELHALTHSPKQNAPAHTPSLSLTHSYTLYISLSFSIFPLSNTLHTVFAFDILDDMTAGSLITNLDAL